MVLCRTVLCYWFRLLAAYAQALFKKMSSERGPPPPRLSLESGPFCLQCDLSTCAAPLTRSCAQLPGGTRRGIRDAGGAELPQKARLPGSLKPLLRPFPTLLRPRSTWKSSAPSSTCRTARWSPAPRARTPLSSSTLSSRRRASCTQTRARRATSRSWPPIWRR